MNERRKAFLKACLDQLRLPYLWDGKGLAGEAYRGRDCSGVVTSAIVEVAGPDWRGSHNAQVLWDELPGPSAIVTGDLVLYGADEEHITHVMVWVLDGVVMGAAGGDSTTTTKAEALRRGACVQVWLSHLYMANFRGFRRIPFLDEAMR